LGARNSMYTRWEVKASPSTPGRTASDEVMLISY
jgi:hypothetical protein